MHMNDRFRNHWRAFRLFAFLLACAVGAPIVASILSTPGADAQDSHGGVGIFCDGPNRVYYINADGANRGRAALAVSPNDRQCTG